MIALVVPASWALFFACVYFAGQYDNTLNRWWKLPAYGCLVAMTALMAFAFD